ncbi:MAG: TraR/DksA family transcriptional regulator [Thermaurantiacus sp.]
MAINLAAIEARLRARLAELAEEDRRAAASTAPVVLDQDSVGRLSRMDALQMQAMALAAMERRTQERNRIDAALKRLHTTDFGWCMRCGDEIATPRLLNDPTVVHCIRCAR